MNGSASQMGGSLITTENDGGVSYRVWNMLKNEMNRVKVNVQDGTIEEPMLTMQRIKNLIHTSTSMLQYFLCF